MTEAWIGLAVGLVAAAVSLVVAYRQSRSDERLERLRAELEAQAEERTRERQAEDVLARYREPLAAAAYDLQRRLFNILRREFLEMYGGGDERGVEAVRTTAFRLAQYFGWTEVLRRDIQFLSFPEDADTREVAELQYRISVAFLTTDDYGRSLMLWTDEQRALGERMIVEEHGKVLCMGYASFADHCDTTFRALCERIEAEIGDDGARRRMRDLQHLLCELVEKLDHRRVRYTTDLDRA